MKKRRISAYAATPAETLATDFSKGFLATGLLASFQNTGANPLATRDWRRILRLALQGGIALGTASLTAESLRRRDYATGLAAMVAGAAGLIVVEKVLNPPPPSPSRGILT